MATIEETLAQYFGASVAGGPDSQLDLMEVRRGLEVQCALLAAQRRTPDEMARLHRLEAELRTALNDPDRYIDLDIALHHTIAVATHNPLMETLIQAIRTASAAETRDGLRYRQTPTQLDRVQILHEQLVAAIDAQDPVAAVQIMARHFDEVSVIFHRIPDRPEARWTAAR